MIRKLKNLIYFAILIGSVIVFWKIFRGMENREPLTPEQRATQKETQRKQAIAIRLHELEETNGAGRTRQNKDVENAARVLYNSRHPNALPLVK